MSTKEYRYVLLLYNPLYIFALGLYTGVLKIPLSIFSFSENVSILFSYERRNVRRRRNGVAESENLPVVVYVVS